jgi:uncharacterized membrane protein (UPF0127 family)
MAGLIDALAADGESPRRLLNARTGRVVATHVVPAFDSRSRRRGLLGYDAMPEGEALVIAPCEAVHTGLMRFPVDLAFITRAGEVLSVRHALRPWRVAASWRAFAVVELAAGALAASDTAPGDALVLSPMDAQ